jgi:hypothetical protein
MAENGNGAQAQTQTPSTTAVLSITFDQLTGQVQVNGPIQNLVLCMGMMEMAKQALHDFAKEQAKGQRIVPAKAMPFIQH